jgi:hypothetical protein
LRGRVLDIESLGAFALGALLFSSKLYRQANVDRFEISFGLVSPLGRQLWLNPGFFRPFSQVYQATSPVDLWVRRTVDTSTPEQEPERQALAFEIVAELTEYFGLVLLQGTWDALLRRIHEDLGSDL